MDYNHPMPIKLTRSQLRAALAVPGVTRLDIGDGLRCDVVMRGDEARLQLSHARRYPTDAEWTRVMRSWPYRLGPQVKRKRHGGRYYLSASWPAEATKAKPGARGVGMIARIVYFKPAQWKEILRRAGEGNAGEFVRRAVEKCLTKSGK